MGIIIEHLLILDTFSSACYRWHNYPLIKRREIDDVCIHCQTAPHTT